MAPASPTTTTRSVTDNSPTAKAEQGPKDLVGETKAQQKKEAHAQARAQNMAAQTAGSNTRRGNSNQTVRDEHNSGAKRNQHEGANEKRAREQAAADAVKAKAKVKSN